MNADSPQADDPLALHPEALKLARRISTWLRYLEATNSGYGHCQIEFARCAIKRLELTETYVAADFIPVLPL